MNDYQRFIKFIKIIDDCWEWQGALSQDGYGYFTLGKLEHAHRSSYKLFKGEIVQGFQIDHLCRNRKCVNPDHLEQVTPKINTLRSPIAVAAINSRKTSCRRGHQLEGDNLYVVPTTGERRCKICTRFNKRRMRSKTREPRDPKRSHCKFNHILDGNNLRYSKSGEWFCKKCVAERQRVYKAKKRLATL